MLCALASGKLLHFVPHTKKCIHFRVKGKNMHAHEIAGWSGRTCTCARTRAHALARAKMHVHTLTELLVSLLLIVSSVQKNADKYFWCQKPFWWCFVVCCRRKAIFLQKLEVWWNLAIFECWLPKNGNNLFFFSWKKSLSFLLVGCLFISQCNTITRGPCKSFKIQ